MALNLQNKYPGRFDPVSADYPQGKFKNRSSPTAQDGSYMERDWLNDWAGFFGAVLSSAGVTPNNIVDTAQSSQLFTALQTVILKSLPKRTFYGNDFIRIPDVPGGLIIQWGNVTTGVSGEGIQNLPVAFPNSVLRTFVTGYETSHPGTARYCSAGTPTNSTVRVYAFNPTGTGVTLGVNWLAVGF